MGKFHYTAYTKTNKRINGYLQADDRREAIEKLRADNLHIVSLGQKKKRKRISSLNLARSFHQLSSLICSGIPLAKALEILEGSPSKLAEVFGEIKRSIERGISFSQGLKNYPQIFPSLLVNMARVGEMGGNLGEVLEEAANYLEEKGQLQARLLQALAYPLFVLFLSFVSLVFLVGVLLPTFSQLFNDLEVELPFLTRLIIGGGDILLASWRMIFLAVILAVAGLVSYGKTERGKYLLSQLQLNLPFFGKTVKKVIVTRFLRTLGVLLKGGVPILDALAGTKEVAGNLVAKEVIDQIIEGVKEGKPLAQMIRKYRLFPQEVYQIVAVGEEAGTLETMLLRAAKMGEEEVNAQIRATTSLIEPLATVFVGLVVAVMAMGMLLPITKIVGTLE